MSAAVPADRDRRAAYDAERFAFEGSWLLAPLTAERATRLTETVVSSPAWRRILPVPLTVGTARGRTSWCRSDGRIAFAPSVEVSTIAHELAHAVCHTRQPDAAGHGATWRGWFVAVVDVLHGAEASGELARSFGVYGLTIDRPALDWTGRPLLGPDAVESAP